MTFAIEVKKKWLGMDVIYFFYYLTTALLSLWLFPPLWVSGTFHWLRGEVGRRHCLSSDRGGRSRGRRVGRVLSFHTQTPTHTHTPPSLSPLTTTTTIFCYPVLYSSLTKTWSNAHTSPHPSFPPSLCSPLFSRWRSRERCLHTLSFVLSALCPRSFWMLEME